MLRSFRPHIGIFGRRNVGKSSFINFISDQEVAIVSEIAGTTTDPIYKMMELGELGPVVLIDTAGIDDLGALGEKRVERSRKVFAQIDLAVLVIADNYFSDDERFLITEFNKKEIPYLIVHNKEDRSPLNEETRKRVQEDYAKEIMGCSCLNRTGLDRLMQGMQKLLPKLKRGTIVGDLVKHGDLVVLVTPIDIEAPQGRLILPQVQVIRDLLDHDCITVVLKERELDLFLQRKITPKLVITDSQAFLKVDASVPKTIPLTSFSILFARLKGDFERYIEGTRAISQLQDGDRILILESCSHHVTGDDIGRVKIPRWINNFTGKRLEFDISAGLDNYPHAIKDYRLVVQCGGCMLTRTQVLQRIAPFIKEKIPVTNYGMAISYVHGIFERALSPFGVTKDGDYL